jgi:simple sugar transport system permease protein
MELISSFMRRPAAAAIISLIAVLLLFVILGGINFRNFLTAGGWLNFAANLGIVAIPVGILMIAGEIDISFGAMVPAGAITTAILSGHFGLPIEIGILAALGLGVVVGLANGILTVRTTVPSLIITLSTLIAMQGIVLTAAKFLTNKASVPLVAPAWAKMLFGQLLGKDHQVIILWWIALAIVFGYVLHRTRYGNWIYALGGDKVSARNAGVPTTRVTITLFILSAVAASFVGVCQAIQFNTAQVSGGMGIIFNAICSVVVGGVLLTGGFGSVPGIFIGTLTFAIANQGIYFTQIDRNWSNLIIGLTLLAAMGMNENFRKLALSYVGKRKTTS